MAILPPLPESRLDKRRAVPGVPQHWTVRASHHVHWAKLPDALTDALTDALADALTVALTDALTNATDALTDAVDAVANYNESTVRVRLHFRE